VINFGGYISSLDWLANRNSYRETACTRSCTYVPRSVGGHSCATLRCRSLRACEGHESCR
jgi:hypothetical protein